MALVVCLLLRCGPPAVRWFIVSVHPDAIQRQIILVPICQSPIPERLEARRPFRANNDATTAIIFVVLPNLGGATVYHSTPFSVQPGISHPVGSFCFFVERFKEVGPLTSAAPLFMDKVASCSDYGFSTIAITQPCCAASFIAPGTFGDGKTSKSLSGKIVYLTHGHTPKKKCPLAQGCSPTSTGIVIV